MLAQLPSILLLIFGFGFVIFFHELGHFLAAKWVGIKVEQFAVGFGQALIAWRKGLGFTFGSSAKKYENLVQARMNQLRTQDQASQLQLKEKVGFNATDEQIAAKSLGIGETEYRLNWIPLGGYVKMLGQDDLNPNAQFEDPRAYNKKSIGARMLVVSAGVIMNILLAVILFTILFTVGFRVQPPVIGSVQSNSPAAHATRLDGTPAPLRVGDRILMYDGQWQHDFTKITLNVALSGEGKVPVYVQRADGTKERVEVNPERADMDANGFLMIGVGPIPELRGLDPAKNGEDEILGGGNPEQFVSKEMLAVRPGDTIKAINGEPVQLDEYWKLDRALQASNGKPVRLTVLTRDGKTEERDIHAQFMKPFTGTLNFAGMVPRATIEQVNTDSSAKGKLMPGDVVVAMAFSADQASISNPTIDEVQLRLAKAGETAQPVDFTVLRDGKELEFKGLVPTVRIAKGKYGLNVALSFDEFHPVVAETIDKSPAQAAGIPAGATITAINGQLVENWFDVKRILAETKPGAAIKLAATTATGPKEFDLTLDKQQVAEIAGYLYASPLVLHEHVEPRKTGSPLTAAAWGVTETRDFVLQFYLTLHRMFQGSVSYKNMMGPVGIFNAGRAFAYKGNDWLIWFLAMISANLAVVNFLPIPIVDGGLFTFLILEKIQGRPLSAKTQSIAQVVGLAIILSVFLLVTYQDIARMAF